MKKLPLGVYAVSESFTEGVVEFTFQQEALVHPIILRSQRH